MRGAGQLDAAEKAGNAAGRWLCAQAVSLPHRVHPHRAAPRPRLLRGGATVEVWADAAQAKQRSEFITTALTAANGVLGEEYHYLDGAALLRVAGAVKPSVAKQYEAAFAG